MAEEKKNPLIGAFRSPPPKEAAKAPPDAKAAEPVKPPAADKGYNAQYDYAESDLDAQSVSYLLCRRFGVERDLPDTAELPALYDGWDAQERRQALDQIQKMSKQIGASVEKSITPQRGRVPIQHNGR